jgi:protein-disulfide isomerase
MTARPYFGTAERWAVPGVGANEWGLHTMGKQAHNTARRQRLAEAAAQRRRAKRNRLLVGGGLLVIVGLLVAIVISLVNAAAGTSGANRRAPAAPVGPVAPAGATAAGAITIGDPAAPVKLEIYLDYMCPYCGRFDRANAQELSRLVDHGIARVEMYPLSFLDKMSNGTRYSTRAANAVATVADRAPGKVLAFSQGLYAQQPHEGSAGLTDDQIADLARGAGVPQDVINRFVDRTFEPWIATFTDRAFASGIDSTPTVKINGDRFQGDLSTAGPLTDAINTAKG